MGKVLVTDTHLTNIAEAIRSKNGTTDTYKPSEMAEAIENIESGGGGTGEKYAPRFISFREYTGSDLDYELANVDTSNLTTMANMFYKCDELINVDLSKWITSNVTSMGSLFNTCKKL